MGFWKDLVLQEVLKRHRFCLSSPTGGSQLAPVAMTLCAKAVANDTSEVYRATRAGPELETEKHLWDKLSAGNEDKPPDQHGENSTAHGKEDQH